MSAQVVVAALVGPFIAMVLLTIGVGVMVFGRRGEDDELRTPPLPRAFVVGALTGAAFLAAGDALGALLGGMSVGSAALAGAAAGFLSAPMVLASLLAGHATILGLTLSFAINAGTLALAAEAL
jgi:hypothetical protein